MTLLLIIGAERKMYPYNNPYEALVLRSYSTDKIVKELRIAGAQGQLRNAESKGLGFIKTLIDKNSEVPVFGHTVIFEDTAYIDVRGLISVTSSNGDYRIKDKAEYDFRVLRAALELSWNNDDDFRDNLLSISDLPLEIYTKWFSEGIAHRLGVDPETQAKLAIVAGMFYLGCIESEVNDKVWQRNVAIVSRATRVPAQRLLEWFPEQLHFSSVDELAMYIAQHLDNPRLAKMNSGLIYSILANGWFTQHGSEVMGVALEMPCTWIACIYHAVDSRALRNSRIGKLLQRSAKGDSAQQFQRAILSLLR